MEHLQIRVAPSQKAAIQRSAREAHLGMSEWVLSRVFPDGSQKFQQLVKQLKSSRDLSHWDPYPLASRDILSFLQQTTSLKAVPERRVVTLEDALLFQSPFLIYTGSGRCSWSQE